LSKKVHPALFALLIDNPVHLFLKVQFNMLLRQQCFHAFKCIVFFILVVAVFAVAEAQPIPGSLDRAPVTGFGNSTGIVTDIAPIRGTANISNYAYDSVIDSAGRIVLVGQCYNNYPLNRYDGCIVRLLSDGSLDNSFSSDGISTLNIGFGDASFKSIRTDSNGKYVLGGECQSSSSGGRQPCIFRVNPTTGLLDTSFGTVISAPVRLGYMPLSNDSGGSSARIELLSNGSIIAVNNCYRSTSTATLSGACVTRLTASGDIDLSYGISGLGRAELADENVYELGLTVKADGKALIVGQCGNRPGKVNRGCVLRLNANGTPDTSFGSATATLGVVSVPIGVDPADVGYFRNALIQSDSKILVTGYCTSGGVSNGRFCAARLNVDGALDSSFGSGGKSLLTTAFIPSSTSSAALQPDGKAIITGVCPNANGSLPCVARIDTNGALDPGFDGDSGNANGALSFNELGGYATVYALALQQDGKIVLSGSCGVPVPNTANITTFCAARLNGGPLPVNTCSMDVDGDGRTYSLVDGLIITRVMMGFGGDAVTNGVQFTSDSKRTTWSQIRQYLVSACQMAITQP
jgi:uncharacterized delta-60 repeat protein